MLTPHLLQDEPITDELALLLVAEKKAGKSWLSATAPGTILFLDFDQRLAALRAHPNVKNIFGISYADSQSANAPPTAFGELQTTLARLEASPRLSALHDIFKGKDQPVDTLVFDSVQTISDAARNFVLYHGGDDQQGVARSFAIGGRKYRVPRSYTAWGAEMEMVSGAILQARALLHCKKCLASVTYQQQSLRHTDTAKQYDHEPTARAMNVIVNLHEAMEEDPRGTETNPIFTGKVTVYPVRYHKLLVYFNEVWRLQRLSGRVPKIQFDPDGQFVQAATALGIPPTAAQTPDIQAILRLARNGK